MKWNTLIDETTLTSLLPETYAHLARPVCEGLVVFLSGLPRPAQQEIIDQQAALPVSATLSERLGLLALCCPVLHKLGQVLARDQRLAPELRHELCKLESAPPTVSLTAIQKLLKQQFGALECRGIELLPPAIAEASVAVVIPFKQLGHGRLSDGVFKILKPGIEERLLLELELLGKVGSHLDEQCDALRIPQLNYRETFEQVRHKLSCEVQLDKEQSNLTEAKAFYAGQPSVQIPSLLPHCTARVTAMERVFGEKVTNHKLTSQTDKRQLARLVTRALIGRPFFSRAGRALFHCDPHAGNLFYTRDRRLAILDWSLAGFLSERERVAMGQIILGAITLHAERIVKVLEDLDQRKLGNRAQLTEVVDHWLRRIRRGQFPGLSWLVGMLDQATQAARLGFAADISLFRKSLFTLEGVISELGAEDFSSDDTLFSEFLFHLTNELPERWFSLPTSRAFSTRLSNADIAETVLSSPLAISRYWQAECLDFMKLCCASPSL